MNRAIRLAADAIQEVPLGFRQERSDRMAAVYTDALRAAGKARELGSPILRGWRSICD
jgi:hypothetical protein